MSRADQRKWHYIYKTTRFDGKYYIGLHSTDNLDDDYLGSGTKLWNSIKRYGKDKHVREILEFLPTREALRLREEQLVNDELLGDPLCMNLARGGQAYSHTEEACKRISEARKGIPNSEEQKKKISDALKGRSKPEGFGEKVSKTLTGRKMTEEQRKKMSLAKLGKPTSQKHKDAVSAGKKGLKQSEEQKRKTSERMKGKPNQSAVKLQKRCTVDGITIYNSVGEFVKALGHGKAGIKNPNFRFV